MFKISAKEYDVYRRAKAAGIIAKDAPMPHSEDEINALTLQCGLLFGTHIVMRNKHDEVEYHCIYTGKEEYAATIAKKHDWPTQHSKVTPCIAIDAWYAYFHNPDDADYTDFMQAFRGKKFELSKEDFLKAFDPVEPMPIENRATLLQRDRIAEAVADGRIAAIDQRTWDHLTTDEAESILDSAEPDDQVLVDHWVKELKRLPREVQIQILKKWESETV